MVSTEIRLITFFVVEDGEAVYSQRKQELELTVAHQAPEPQSTPGLVFADYIEVVHLHLQRI